MTSLLPLHLYILNKFKFNNCAILGGLEIFCDGLERELGPVDESLVSFIKIDI